jgi:hypothetical protein
MEKLPNTPELYVVARAKATEDNHFLTFEHILEISKELKKPCKEIDWSDLSPDNLFEIRKYLFFHENDAFSDIEFFKNLVLNKSIVKTVVYRIERTISNILKTEVSEIEDIDDWFIETAISTEQDHLEQLKVKLNELLELIPDYQLKLLVHPEKETTRNKITTVLRKTRLFALQEFCPELIQDLRNTNKETQKEIINLITDVNKTDCYKFLFTKENKNLNISFERKQRIDELKQIKNQ